MDATFKEKLKQHAANVFASVKAREEAVAELKEAIEAATEGVGPEAAAYIGYTENKATPGVTYLHPDVNTVGPRIGVYDGGKVIIGYSRDNADEIDKLENKHLQVLVGFLANRAKDRWVAAEAAVNQPAPTNIRNALPQPGN